MSATIAAAIAHLEHEEDEHQPPPMPQESGVEAPRNKPSHRLTDNYYKLERDEWVPRIINDPKLPGLILEGGQKLSLKYTRQRDQVVTWLLFDTGARISEVCGLMLGDWAVLGTHTKARAFSKGSFGQRVKTISFYDDTVVLLKRYFDEERIRFDPNGYQLDDYLLLAKRKQVDLQTIPLFLSTQGTQLTPKAYREHYWNPACAAAGIEADVHQARHWHVTLEVRDIYETAKSKEEIERRLRGLIEYMKWRSEETLAAYQHYFDEKANADTRDNFHRRMHEAVQQYLQERQSGRRKKSGAPMHQDKATEPSSQTELSLLDEPDLAFLTVWPGRCDMSLKGTRYTWGDLAGHIASEVLQAPKTGGDPNGDWPLVHERIAGYIRRNLLGTPWADHVALIAAVLTARRRDVQTVALVVQALHGRFRALFPALELKTIFDWKPDLHLPGYLKGAIVPGDSQYTRQSFLNKYLSATRQVQNWFDALPLTEQEIYRRFVLPVVNPLAIEGLDKKKEVTRQQQEARKLETAAIVPNFAQLRAEAHFRYNRLARLRQVYQQVLKQVLPDRSNLHWTSLTRREILPRNGCIFASGIDAALSVSIGSSILRACEVKQKTSKRLIQMNATASCLSL